MACSPYRGYAGHWGSNTKTKASSSARERVTQTNGCSLCNLLSLPTPLPIQMPPSQPLKAAKAWTLSSVIPWGPPRCFCPVQCPFTHLTPHCTGWSSQDAEMTRSLFPPAARLSGSPCSRCEFQSLAQSLLLTAAASHPSLLSLPPAPHCIHMLNSQHAAPLAPSHLPHAPSSSLP